MDDIDIMNVLRIVLVGLLCVPLLYVSVKFTWNLVNEAIKKQK